MKRKEINARVISKHDTPVEWKMATDFVPEQGEIIIYDETNEIGPSKIKIGDGKRNINDLPFIAEPEKYVLKETGKSLSTNDYANPDKNAVQKMVDFIEKNGEPKFTDTVYFAGTGLGLSNNMFSNTGVLDISLQPHINSDEPTYQEIIVTKANSDSIVLKQPSYLLNDNLQPSSTSKPGVFEIKYYSQPNDGTEGHVVTREIQIEGCYSEEDIRDRISEQINEIPGIVSEIFIYNSTDEESESPAGQPLVIDSGTQTLYYRPDADSGLNTLFSKEMLDKNIVATEEELLPYDEENDTGLLTYNYIKLQIKPTSGEILYKDENNNLVPLILRDYLPITGGHITGDLAIDGSVTLKTPLAIENGGTGANSLSELSNKLELNKAIVDITYDNVDSYVYTKMDGSTGSFPAAGEKQKTHITVTPILTSGEKIATITVDGVQNNLYVESCLPIAGGTLTGDLILQRNIDDPTKSCRINAAYADLDKINGNSIELFNGSYIDFHLGYEGPGDAPDWSARLVEESAGGLTAYNWLHIKDKEYTTESTTYLRYNSIETTSITASGEITGDKVIGAVWNDYAEYRTANTHEPGRVIRETGKGSLTLTTERLMPGCEIVSDTFGFSIGKTEENNVPVAIAGRVLAYTYEPRETFVAGEPVCSGPNGTVSKMTREEVKEYPDRIIGTVSEIPSYETWGSGNVPVNNRIWIRIR